jgi:hypothetical protein
MMSSSVVVMSVFGRDRLDYLKIAVDSTLGANGGHSLLLGVEEPLPAELDGYLNSLADNARVQVKRYPAGYGFAPVLNALIESAIADPSCELIFRMDGDDICRADRFVRQERFFRENPVVDVVGSWATMIDESGLPIGEVRKLASQEQLKRALPVDSPLLHPTVAFRAAVVRKGFRYPINIVCEDLAFWAKLLEAGVILGNIQEYLLEYRQTLSTYRRRKGFAQGWPAMTVRLQYIRKVMPWRLDLAALVILVTVAKAVVPVAVMGKLYELSTHLLS